MGRNVGCWHSGVLGRRRFHPDCGAKGKGTPRGTHFTTTNPHECVVWGVIVRVHGPWILPTAIMG